MTTLIIIGTCSLIGLGLVVLIVRLTRGKAKATEQNRQCQENLEAAKRNEKIASDIRGNDRDVNHDILHEAVPKRVPDSSVSNT